MFSKSSNAYGLSTLRLWLMRVPYFFTGVLFSITAWSSLITYWGEFDATEGVAFAFWGALSLLALIGLRFPVKMLPLLVLQFAYKIIWLLAVGYPLLQQGELDAAGMELFQANALGAVIDLIAIPWWFFVKTYLLAAFTRSSER